MEAVVAPLAAAVATKGLGALAAALAVAGAFVLHDPRARGLSALLALALTPVLVVSELWDTSQVQALRHNPTRAAMAVVVGAAVVAALAAVFHRRPTWLPLALVAALPFRLPVGSGGDTANLLIPLYVVLGGGVVAYAWERLRPPRRAAGEDNGARPPAWAETPPGRLEIALLAALALYALQAFYSSDFEQALKNVAFFYVPFALMFKLLTTIRWTRRLVVRCFALTVVLALVFALIGFFEFGTRDLLWNRKVIESNQFQSYFRVNSLFFDPNIYGRFLAIVMVGLGAALLWARRGRDLAVSAGAFALLWAALLLTYSQSSFAALLAGLAVLTALRWRTRPVLIVIACALIAGVGVSAAAPGLVHFRIGSAKSLDSATSGRFDLIRGGLSMFADRPVWGFGSGSFAATYRKRERVSSREAASASHNTALTVAAEQGVVGLAAYGFVLVSAFTLLFAGLRRLRGRAPPPRLVSRAFVAAGFTALVVHTMLYAAFLEDPISWALLALAVVLSRSELTGPPPSASPADRGESALPDRPSPRPATA
jgi:O-antigen ligase